MSRWGPLLVLLLGVALGLILHRHDYGPSLDLVWDYGPSLDLVWDYGPNLDQLKNVFTSAQKQPGPDSVQSGPDSVQPGPDSVQSGPDSVQPGPDSVQPGPDSVQSGPDSVQPGPDSVQTLEERVALAWEKIIKPPENRWTRAAVGVNSCVDVVVSGVALLKALGLQPSHPPSDAPSKPSDLDHEVLRSLDDLRDTFEFFMSRGAAAERFFSDAQTFQRIAHTALNIPGAKLYVGGNAALIGQKLASNPDTEVLLAGPVGPKLHELLDEKILVPPESLQETDEYHLILEYQTGEQWSPLVVAPQASRFIFSHDEQNSLMSSAHSLIHSLDSFGPEVLVLSGFHMMEGLQAEERSERLEEVVALLSQVSVPVHLELASMTDSNFMKKITDTVFPLVSSLGLNEQELLFLSRSVGGPHSGGVSWSDVGVSSAVGVSTDVLGWILREFGSLSGAGSRLSRVHFHSLPFHVVAVVTGGGVWGNQKVSVAAGARTASTQACGRAHVHAHETQLKAPPTDPDRPITVWEEDHVTFHLSPVLVCKRPIRTVGLGDAISANGLLFSEISPAPH